MSSEESVFFPEEEPPEDFIKAQLSLIEERMAKVNDGTSRLIPAKEAHRIVRESLRKTE